MVDIDSILNRNLTKDQLDAAKDPASEILTLACAGSGKSRTLAFRIARLIAEGADPASIVAFTFTEKAAESIKLQVAKALAAAGIEPGILGAMYIGTIHSYCQNVLSAMDARYRQFDVLDENRFKLYLISRYSTLGLVSVRHRARGYFDCIRQVSEAWKTLNDEMLSITDVSVHDNELGTVLDTLRERLDDDEFIDFSLMIRLAVEALQRQDSGALRAVASLQHLMVDEYQDVNPAQEALIRELHRCSSTLFVVGDDDQSIYAWRGADVTNILEFEQRYPASSRHTLAHNFRSTQAIVQAADQFAAAELGATRIAKHPVATDPEGPRDFRKLWFANRAEEATWVAERIAALLGKAYAERDGTIRGLTPGDFAILMRSTRSKEGDESPRHAAFTQTLNSLGIPFTLEAGGGVFDRPQVAVLRASFDLLRDGTPTREAAREFFQAEVFPSFPQADFQAFARVLTEWGRLIHAATEGTRRRVYPQQLVHDLLHAFGIQRSSFDIGVMRDLGLFSRMIQDVEAVYLSIDSSRRFGEICNFLHNVAETGYDTATEDVLRRPDAVTVSTVHKMKGLEFPVVFIVDVEANRFPNTRRNFQGWLPRELIQGALDRGAYRGTRDEEARLFYTALTRSERYLYVTGCASLPGGVRNWQPSPFSQRLNHLEISTEPDGLPAGLSTSDPRPRIDETVVPTSYSDIRYYLRCPRDYQFRKSFAFSPPIAEMFGFGQTVHTAVTKLHEVFTDHAPTDAEADVIAKRVFHLKHAPQSRNPDTNPGPYERARDSARRVVRTYAGSYAEDFEHRREVEARFEVPVQQAVISGSIDLMLKVDEAGQVVEAQVVDFKTLEGSEDPEENEQLHWTELALQVQLYAKAAKEVLGENARTGSVHFLKDNQRVEVPVNTEAIGAAIANVEWAVDRVIAGDFPMRPHRNKCERCDFRALCPRVAQQFGTSTLPPSIHVPKDPRIEMARAFSEFEECF